MKILQSESRRSGHISTGDAATQTTGAHPRLAGWTALCAFALVLLTMPGGARALDAEALAADLDALRRDAGSPALAIAIVAEGGPPFVRAFGTARSDTPFRWGSITKTFTALTALTAVERGELDLNDPVRRWLPDGYYENPWAEDQPLRILHLLALSGGFADLAREEWNDNTPLTLDAALDRGAPHRRVLWPPGLQHSYSNAAPGLTAAVLERAGGYPFAELMTRRVLRPLGMSRASLAPLPGLPGGYQADGRTEIPYWHMTFPAFGALNASIEDMSRFLLALTGGSPLPGARALPGGKVAGLFRPTGYLGARAGLEVGYGLGIYGRVSNGHVFWGHGGDADGYRSRYGVLPEASRAYAVVVNVDNPPLLRRLSRRLEAALSAGLSPPSPPPVARVPLEALTGRYYPASRRFGLPAWQQGKAGRLEIRAADHRLTLESGRTRYILLPVDGTRFRRPGDPRVTAVFARDPRGYLYLQGETGNFVRVTDTQCPDFLAHCE